MVIVVEGGAEMTQAAGLKEPRGSLKKLFLGLKSSGYFGCKRSFSFLAFAVLFLQEQITSQPVWRGGVIAAIKHTPNVHAVHMACENCIKRRKKKKKNGTDPR